MDNNDSPKGFAGLSSITTPETENPSVSEQIDYELISITEHPSMASPWTGKGPGEGWKWGDFFITVQERPETVFDTMAKMTKRSERFDGLIYHFAATVFCDPDKNKFGRSSRPIIVVGIEQSDMSEVAKKMGVDVSELTEDGGKMGPIMVGMFSGDVRMNLGNYDGPLTLDATRKVLFDRIRERLGLSGEPERIGTIEAVREKVITRKIDSDALMATTKTGSFAGGTLSQIPRRNLVIGGAAVAFIAFGVIFKPSPLASIFGTRNFEECVLHEMKGQQSNLLPMARKKCRSSFPPEVAIDASEVTWEWVAESATTASINITKSPANMKLTTIVAWFSEKPCGSAAFSDLDNPITKTAEAPFFGSTFKFDLPSGNRKCVSATVYGVER